MDHDPNQHEHAAHDHAGHDPGPRPTSSSRDINANALWLTAIASITILITAIVGGQAAFRFARQSERDRKAEMVDQIARDEGYNPRLAIDRDEQARQHANLDQRQWADYDKTHAFVPMDVAMPIVAQQLVVESSD